ncbi:type IV pilin [Halorhabdus sp. CUG00001]|uniref:type IV pilin n=1 Tax=Halorhabdus sp. CUG00001 TaxID=2600297 RepID=UPI00131E12DD|nr:type IV pilin N-terminal domain-containing protein [Halorhabdus sp. CUG00001]
MAQRAISPVVGTVLLVAITIVLAGTVGAVVFTPDVEPSIPATRFSATADASADSITLTHEGGQALDPDTLDVRITVDGRSLDHQPPIPFFAATGFESGPTGPFNSATRGNWTAGETGVLELATSNAPLVSDGASVEITVRRDGHVLTELEVIAE